MVERAIVAARECGFRSSNIDLVYGLPCQTEERFAVTVERIVELQPERIALFRYAHMPQRFKAQRMIDIGALPSSQQSAAIAARSRQQLLDAGYVAIGLDHFARPDDELALARANGRLHRNFQGYSTMPDTALIGLGPSAISQVGDGMAQNVKSFEDWRQRLDAGSQPTERGLTRTRDDRLRAGVIMAIMCDGEVDRTAIEMAWQIDFSSRFAFELERLRAFVAHGLVEIDDERIRVTNRGQQQALRSIAAVFDLGRRRPGAAA